MPDAPQRVAIVTGAARGIGAATARRLADDGLAVAVLDLEETAAAATAETITAGGGTAIAVSADVATQLRSTPRSPASSRNSVHRLCW